MFPHLFLVISSATLSLFLYQKYYFQRLLQFLIPLFPCLFKSVLLDVFIKVSSFCLTSCMLPHLMINSQLIFSIHYQHSILKISSSLVFVESLPLAFISSHWSLLLEALCWFLLLSDFTHYRHRQVMLSSVPFSSLQAMH